MTRRNFFAFLTLISLGSTAPLALADDASHRGGSVKRLQIGQTWRFDDGLKVTFLSVKSDSRCPTGARCISEGDAEVVFRVTAGKGKPRKVVLHTTQDPQFVLIPAQPAGTIGIPKSYVIELRALAPYPAIGKEIPDAAYRAKLRISIAQ